jgi:hypothetical protein
MLWSRSLLFRIGNGVGAPTAIPSQHAIRRALVSGPEGEEKDQFGIRFLASPRATPPPYGIRLFVLVCSKSKFWKGAANKTFERTSKSPNVRIKDRLIVALLSALK